MTQQLVAGDGDRIIIRTGLNTNVGLNLEVNLYEAPPPRPEAPARPPAVWQRDVLRWGNKRYTRQSALTFAQAGCLVLSHHALARWAGYDVTPEAFAAALDEQGAFSGGELHHPSAITRAYPRLVWHGAGDRWILGRETSFVNWEARPVELDVLQFVLDRQPAAAKVDLIPGGTVQQHFVLALEYIPDPEGGVYDDLIVMDPWLGTYTGVRAYAHPSWLSWCQRTGTTLVQRTLLGLRAPEVV